MICVNCGKEINYRDLKEKGISFDENAKVCTYCVTNFCSRKKILYKDFADRLVIDDKVFDDTRPIVILLNNKVEKKKGKKIYREIIGLDVLSGGIVKIIDENGKIEGLHTDSEYIGKLDINHSTKASFRFIDDVRCINTWRITSEYGELKKTNLRQLREKYRRTHFFDVCVEFDDVSDFANESDKPFYCLVNFTGSWVCRDKEGNMCLKMGKNKVTLDKNFENSTVTEGAMFRGIALLYVFKKGERSKFIAKYLYDDCQKNIPHEQMSGEGKGQIKKFERKGKFEKLLFDTLEYVSELEEVQSDLTEEENLNIKNDIKQSDDVINENYQKKLVNSFFAERVWTI